MKDLISSKDDDTEFYSQLQFCCERQPCNVSDDFTETKVKS